MSSNFLFLSGIIKHMSTIASSQPQFAMDTAAIKKAASVYRAIYHPLRLQIVELIHKTGTINVTPIIKRFKLEQSLISAHLKILRDASLLNTQREGQQIFYSVNYKQLNRLSEFTRKLLLTPPSQQDVDLKLPARKTKTLSSSSSSKFTPAEQKVIRLVCQQYTSEEMAEELGLSKRTVEGYRANILEKMKVRNSVGILIYAVKNGMFKI
jgi:DNA-binding CsgD family transcriptional regulator/DNA-binding transcriptional ArsR family regulator